MTKKEEKITIKLRWEGKLKKNPRILNARAMKGDTAGYYQQGPGETGPLRAKAI